MKENTFHDLTEQYLTRARALVAQMTLEEKVLQTVHKAGAVDRLGIKAYNWWNEALHGVARAGLATVFPQAIGLAATFDEVLLSEIGDRISTEGRAKFNMQQQFGDTDIYKGLTFWAPNVNIFRDPRWGRGHETYGEDPYLTSRLGVSFINGIQGNDPTYMKAAACAKHFAVHSGPEDVRHSFNAVVSAQDLHETYLPAFKACVEEAQVEAVMGAYNRTNDEPCCGSKTLLKDILRDTWGFKGHVVSDCWAIKDFHEYHHVTAGPLQSVALAMNNGCDINCGHLFLYLEQAVKEGLVSEERLDEAITHLLATRMKLGLFDEPEKSPYKHLGMLDVDTKEAAELNYKAACESMVLLKNEGKLLPLDKNKLKTIGVIGPNANNRKALLGNYEGTASAFTTLSEGIQDYVGESARVLVSEGCHLFKTSTSGLAEENDRISEVKGICAASDVIVACFGLDPGLEGEEGDQGNEFSSGDKPNINLPGIQEEVLKTIVASGKPVVLVLLSGSALAVTWADEHIPAIVQGWYPGSLGGKALASLLFGDHSPEGKLPITFYRTSEELPCFEDYSMKGRTYRYMKNEALYPFGFGLSYTKFELSDIKVSSQEIVVNQPITLTLNMTNTGAQKGAETLQVYIEAVRDNVPNPQLKYFKKVRLEAGESIALEVQLTNEAFGLYNEAGVKVVQEGQYNIYVGTNQPDTRSVALTGQKPTCISVKAMYSL